METEGQIGPCGSYTYTLCKTIGKIWLNLALYFILYTIDKSQKPKIYLILLTNLALYLILIGIYSNILIIQGF